MVQVQAIASTVYEHEPRPVPDAVIELGEAFGPNDAAELDDGPVVVASARKHGLADDDTLPAYRNPIRVFEFDDLTMVIGADSAGRMLEIGLASDSLRPRGSSSSCTPCPPAQSS
jgi:hypothetical protein